MARAAPKKFDPKTMKVDKKDPKVIYDSTRNIEDSLAFSTGYVLIGVKDKPSQKDIKETVTHEKSHIGEQVHGPYEEVSKVDKIRRELRAYSREKASVSAQVWNGILPTRICDFMRYISWLSKAEQANIKPEAKRILTAKEGGGNNEAIQQAHADLAQWWLEEERVPAKYTRSTAAISRDLSKRHVPTMTIVTQQKPIKVGVCYTNKGRLSRKPRKGWRRVKFT